MFDNKKDTLGCLFYYKILILPKIQESEDEIISKEIISYIKSSGVISNKKWIAWLESQGKQDIDISSFPKEQQAFMQKYVSFDKITLIKLLSERDATNAEIIESFEKQGEHKAADRIEPKKFNVGELVVNTITNNVEQIIEVTSNEYMCSGLLDLPSVTSPLCNM